MEIVEKQEAKRLSNGFETDTSKSVDIQENVRTGETLTEI